MAVEKWTPERRRALTRSALIDAAASVFARRGYEGASLDEIASAAGFTRGAIYKNFGGKEDLFFAVFDRSVETNLARFGERFDGAAMATRDARESAAAWRDVLVRDLDAYALGLEFRLYALRNPQVGERLAEHQRRERAKVAEFMEQLAASADLELAMPADRLAGILVAASEGFLAAVYLDPDDDDLFASFLELIMPALSAPTVEAPG